MHLLLVEDDEAIAEKLQHELEREGYACTWASTVAEGLTRLGSGRPELVLLDLNLPDGSGFDFLRKVREGSHIPIIVLTARLLGDDKVRALDLGADDYVTKPFWTNEVVARIRAVSRRHHLVPRPGMRLRFDDVVVDLSSMSASVSSNPAQLTPTEFDLLAYLLQHPDEALTQSRLADRVLEDAPPDAVRVHVSRLRKKLGEAGARIETVWGIGYRFRSEA